MNSAESVKRDWLLVGMTMISLFATLVFCAAWFRMEHHFSDNSQEWKEGFEKISAPNEADRKLLRSIVDIMSKNLREQRETVAQAEKDRQHILELLISAENSHAKTIEIMTTLSALQKDMTKILANPKSHHHHKISAEYSLTINNGSETTVYMRRGKHEQ